MVERHSGGLVVGGSRNFRRITEGLMLLQRGSIVDIKMALTSQHLQTRAHGHCTERERLSNESTPGKIPPVAEGPREARAVRVKRKASARGTLRATPKSEAALARVEASHSERGMGYRAIF